MNKNSLKWIWAVNLLAVLLLCFFSGCSGAGEEPVESGTRNKTYDRDPSELLQPVFSDRGGFYGNKMALRITVPETFQTSAASIRITFDGSEPDAGSEAYDGGDIILPDAGCVKTDFERNDRNLSVSVVRAACFDGDGNRLGQIATATYIKLPKKDGEVDWNRFNMPVISLVTEEGNLTNPQTGIFANVQGRGSEWERPVHITFFEADGTLAFAQDAGIRLFGSSTRGLAQKSFRITARKEEYFNTDKYDGAGKFRYALFPDRLQSSGEPLAAYDSIVLRNGGNDSILVGEDNSRISFMRDGLAALITQKAAPEVDAMAYRPVVVFLNGEYYGIMNMREFENKKYIQNVYGIEDEEGIAVISTEMDTSNGGRYDGTWFYYNQDDGPKGELQQFVTLLDDIVSKGRYTYEEAAERIDMDNFMKYCAINLFLCNTDWPHNNVRVWRYAGDNPGALADSSAADGRWRFMLKDADVGLGRYICGMYEGYPIELYTKADSENFRLLLCQYLDFEDQSGYPSVTENFYPDTLQIQGLFYFCMRDAGFASGFYEYCNRLATELWTPEALESLILDTASLLEEEMKNYLVKDFGQWQWESSTNYEAWENAVSGERDSLLTWARDRSGADGEFLKQVEKLRNMLA